MENNKYSTYTPINVRQSPDLDLEKVVTGIGIEYVKSNGDNLFEVDALCKKVISKVRSGKPFFVEFDTYRRLEHCGPNLDDELGYRSSNEINSFDKRDPIKIVKSIFPDELHTIQAINTYEEYLPTYIHSIYESLKQSENEHPELSESDCFQSI
jgi:pyruvate dehydrogenase E1 component alpha subunit